MSDDSPEILSWRHALEFLAKDEGCYPSALLSVLTTSPLRLPADIFRAVRLEFAEKPCDLVVTVTLSKWNPYFNMMEMDANDQLELVCGVEFMLLAEASGSASI